MQLSKIQDQQEVILEAIKIPLAKSGSNISDVEVIIMESR